MSNEHAKKIAIVGVGCRLPGDSNCPAQFWALLEQGRNGVTAAPESRYCPELMGRADVPGKCVSTHAGYINDLDQFDGLQFSIGGREVSEMRLGQRLLLEVAEQALYDSGIPYQGSDMGVFVADTGHNDLETDLVDIGPYFMSGRSASIGANRIGFVFDLRGPNVSIKTACSSSLSAVHAAMSALCNDECPTALVAGANILTSTQEFVAFSKLGVLSPTGLCRSFDASADGYVRGEGAAAV